MIQKYIYPSLFPEEELNENISSERKEYDLTNLFERLAKSDFRSRFHLSKKDREYVMEKGLPTDAKPRAISSLLEYCRGAKEEGEANDTQTRRGFRSKKTCSGCYTERRQADSYAWASCFLGSTCHRLLLPGLFLQVASYSSRQGTD